MQRRTKRLLSIAALFVALIAASGAAYLHWVVGPGIQAWLPPEDRPFERTAWERGARSCALENPRGGMAAGLERQLRAEHPPRAGVRALLGAGDAEEGPALLSYNIGSYKGVSLDCYTLDVRFDSAGRFTEAAIVQH